MHIVSKLVRKQESFICKLKFKLQTPLIGGAEVAMIEAWFYAEVSDNLFIIIAILIWKWILKNVVYLCNCGFIWIDLNFVCNRTLLDYMTLNGNASYYITFDFNCIWCFSVLFYSDKNIVWGILEILFGKYYYTIFFTKYHINNYTFINVLYQWLSNTADPVIPTTESIFSVYYFLSFC